MVLFVDWLSTLLLSFHLLFTRQQSATIKQASAERIAENVLIRNPLIDLHVDLPIALRFGYRNDISNISYAGPLWGHVDLTRLQQGRSGGFFSIAYADCPDSPKGGASPEEANEILLRPNNVVRDTLEQIDVTHRLVADNPDKVGLATHARDVKALHRQGKITHLIGIEGAHSLGNSLAVLRTYHALGVRYLTLTHVCHNAFADTAGGTDGTTAEPLHGGLSGLGKQLVQEMNRIGMIVDVSHTSDDTARQAIRLSKAPVIFSHSGARAIRDHPRNVPDDVLEMIAEASGRDGVVGIPVLPDFVGSNPTLAQVADHVEHIAQVAGKSRVAIGTDFDGFLETPIEGLKDVRDYRNLLTELALRGWREKELANLVSGNFLRVFSQVERVAKDLADSQPKADTRPWDARPDLRPPKHLL